MDIKKDFNQKEDINKKDDIFKEINHKPYGGNIQTLAEHAINCLTICMDISWQEAYQILLQQSQILGLMPNHIQCINQMLKTLGFVKLTRRRGLPLPEIHEIYDFAEYMEYSAAEIKNSAAPEAPANIAILHSGSNSQYGVMLAAIPIHTAPIHYQCQGAAPYVSHTAAIWIGNPHKIAAALESFRAQKNQPQNNAESLLQNSAQTSEPGFELAPAPNFNSNTEPSFCQETSPSNKNHEYFQYFQPNPMQRNIGDCVIRAFAAVFHISWTESMVRLGDAIGYGDTTVNSNLVFINLLIKEGFERHRTLTQNKCRLTGKQFCEQMNATYTNGERIFAFVGRSHVAAVLPYTDNVGKTHYRITDSWDCTDHKIMEYWVKVPEPTELPHSHNADSDEQKEVQEQGFAVGNTVMHPRFGRGTILHITDKNNDQLLEIDFASAGIKKLVRIWVEKNCR